jgi:hypothetical protein
VNSDGYQLLHAFVIATHKFRSEILWFVDQAHNNAGEKQRQRLYALGLLGMGSEKTLLGMESEKMNMLE